MHWLLSSVVKLSLLLVLARCQADDVGLNVPGQTLVDFTCKGEAQYVMYTKSGGSAFVEANSTCAAMGGKVLMVKNQQEFNDVQAFADLVSPSGTRFFVGLFDFRGVVDAFNPSRFETVDEENFNFSLFSKAKVAPWKSTEPNNQNGNEGCVLWDVDTALWQDISCTTKMNIMCRRACPTATASPTEFPSVSPTFQPTTLLPTSSPTRLPTKLPTPHPTKIATSAPTEGTKELILSPSVTVVAVFGGLVLIGALALFLYAKKKVDQEGMIKLGPVISEPDLSDISDFELSGSYNTERAPSSTLARRNQMPHF